jgi:[ribosomal protein S5]-alanine N-acetyltransferase
VTAAVRDARPEDAGAISAVAHAGWHETYRDIFTVEYIERFLAAAYDPDRLRHVVARAAERDDEHFLVAERGGEVIAYAHYGRGEHGPELFRIYAHPAHYGSGAGHALLEELHRRLERRVERYGLDVHAQNSRGRAFYRRHGFVVAGEGTAPDCHLRLERVLDARRPALPIETERLRLRPWDDDDLEGLHAIYGHAETMRYVGSRGRPTEDLAATRRVMDSLREHEGLHGFTLWPVDERDGERLVAIAGLAWVEGEGPDVEAAYLVRHDRWGRGYATEVLRAVLDIGRRQLGLDRIVALAYPENDASRRVMEKAGMRADGIQHAYGRELTRHIWP